MAFGNPKHVALALVLAGLAGAAGPARAEGLALDLEATVGGQHLGVNRAPLVNQLSPMGDFGATALLAVSGVALGLAAEGNFQGSTLQRYNASVVAGFAADLLPVLRLELLGEYGAANLRTRGDLERAAAHDGGWSRFYGFRPGLSVKLPVLPFRAGVWGLARWNMPGTGGKGPEYGMLGRVGFSF